MPISTRLTELLGIKHPVLLAPMDLVADGRLAAIVSRAGGFGIIGGGYGDEAWLTREMDAAGDARVGVGFITWSMAKDPRLLDLVLERRPPAVMLSFGEVRPYAEKIKRAGALLICQVQTLEQAKDAVASGADVLVAQAEAGGHGISRGTFSFVPAVVDAARGSPVAARRRRSGRPRARRRPDAGGGRRSGWHSLLRDAGGCRACRREGTHRNGHW
jgi:nitronate monooxygenase